MFYLFIKSKTLEILVLRILCSVVFSVSLDLVFVDVWRRDYIKVLSCFMISFLYIILVCIYRDCCLVVYVFCVVLIMFHLDPSRIIGSQKCIGLEMASMVLISVGGSNLYFILRFASNESIYLCNVCVFICHLFFNLSFVSLLWDGFSPERVKTEVISFRLIVGMTLCIFSICIFIVFQCFPLFSLSVFVILRILFGYFCLLQTIAFEDFAVLDIDIVIPFGFYL